MGIDQRSLILSHLHVVSHVVLPACDILSLSLIEKNSLLILYVRLTCPLLHNVLSFPQ